MQGNISAASGPAIPIIKLEELSFSWFAGLPTLFDIDYLAIEPGEKLFIEGPRGSGQSTLLNLPAGGLLPQEGEAGYWHLA